MKTNETGGAAAYMRMIHTYRHTRAGLRDSELRLMTIRKEFPESIDSIHEFLEYSIFPH